MDLLRPGVPQHSGEVHGGSADLCHPGVELRPADLHLPAQVLHPAAEARAEPRGHDEAESQTAGRGLHRDVRLARYRRDAGQQLHRIHRHR